MVAYKWGSNLRDVQSGRNMSDIPAILSNMLYCAVWSRLYPVKRWHNIEFNPAMPEDTSRNIAGEAPNPFLLHVGIDIGPTHT